MIDTSGSSAINNPTIATFALHPEEVLKLISASKLGEIYMSLRPANPQSAYVDEMEYTIESVNAPTPKSQRNREREQPEESTPVIPSNTTPDTPLPQLPAVPAPPPVPKIEIIQGDEITQKADEAPVIITPANSATPTPPLPVIPSGSANVPQVNSPLAEAPFVGSNVIRPPNNN